MLSEFKKYQNQSFHNCPECNGNIIFNRFEKVCQSCGLVIDTFSISNNYQMNENEEIQSNSGVQYVSIGKTVDNVCTLGSHIDYFSNFTFFDCKKQLISAKYQKLFKKLKKYYSLPAKIKNHETDYRILKILAKVSEYMHLSTTVRNRAAYIYHEIKKNASQVRNHVSLIGYCIFLASKENKSNCPISIKELCNVFSILGHRINSKLIIRDCMNYQTITKKRINPHKSEDYISRFIDNIVNSQEVHERMKIKSSKWSKEQYRLLLMKKCTEILSKLHSKIRGSRNPFILAAAVVYCADKMIAIEMNTKTILTQKTASKAMKVAEYSIRDHYVKILKPFFNL